MMNLTTLVQKYGSLKKVIIFILIELIRKMKEYIVYVMRAKEQLLIVYQKQIQIRDNEDWCTQLKI